jgi:hypothetical protein
LVAVGAVAGGLRSLVGLRRALLGCLGLLVGAVDVAECALVVALGLLLGAPRVAGLLKRLVAVALGLLGAGDREIAPVVRSIEVRER